MQTDLQAEQLSQDYWSWRERVAFTASSTASIMRFYAAHAVWTLRHNPRARWAGIAGLGAIVVLTYGISRNSSEAMASPPTAPAIAKASLPIVKTSNEIDVLKAALAEQNATNQQMVTAIDELRAEQGKLRKQIAAIQATKASAITTGSITPRPQPKAPPPTKKAEQSDARPAPYPAEARHVPYPPRSN